MPQIEVTTPLEAGQPAEPFTVGPITRTDFVRYAGASGDFNPIHHDEEFARSAGMPSVFAQGMLPAGILATFVARWLGRANVRRLSLRFADQVWPGDELTFTGRVEQIVEDAGERLAQCAFTVERQTGQTVLTATAEAVTDRLDPRSEGA